MTHFRRYEFKKQRYCSTPAVASLDDFSDHFVEQLKNKIRIEEAAAVTTEAKNTNGHGSRKRSYRDTQPIVESSDDEHSAEARLKNMSLGDENHERPSKGVLVPSSGNGNLTNTHSSDTEDSVFKSASWLSASELIFSLSNQVGGLVRALRIFEELNIGIKHVESRKSKRHDSEFEIFVDIDCSDQEKMKKLIHHLR